MPEPRRPDAAEPAPPAGRPLPTALLVTAIVLVALNLRPSMAGFGPLLAQMQHDLGATAGVMGLLSTVPLLLWGVLAPVAPWLTRRLSSETVVLACLLVLALGAALRAGPTLGVIMGGTVLVGAAIAVMNVLLPGLVKRDFPRHTGLMTGVYTMALVGGASLASGLAVPLRDALGGDWRHSMAAWAVFALVGALAWLPTLLATRHHQAPLPGPRAPLWKSPLAWQLTMYMGLQSLVFFAWLTWLPRLLQDHGLTTAESGWLLAVGNVVQIPVTLVLPILAGRMARQRGLAVATAAVTAAGLLGLLVAPTAAPIAWMLLLGIGGGASISLALMLNVLRARDNRQVAQLSAMAQGVGYLLSALGPLLFGWLYDVTARWEPSLWLLLACTVAMGVFGMGAGRAAYVGDPGP